MTRTQQSDHNQQVIQILINLVKYQSYKSVVDLLNNQGIHSSPGNPWTRKSLFRMLQRNGYGGLHGLKQASSRL